MNDLIVYENSLWGKFKRKISKFLRIFKRKENVAHQNIQKQASEVNLSNKLQKELATIEDKKILLENVNDNMDIVQNFSKERLKQVSLLFDEACEIKMKKINELKRKIQTIQNSEP